MAAKLRLGELSVVQDVPGEDHVGRVFPGGRPSDEPVGDRTGAADHQMVESYASHDE